MKTLLTFTLLAGAAFAQSPSVKLDWTANPVNPSGATYNAYRAPGACGTPGQTFTKLNTANVSALTYTDTTVTPGQTYAYHVRTGSGAQESAPSVCATAVIPFAPPTGFTINITLTATATFKDSGVEFAVNGTAAAPPELTKLLGQAMGMGSTPATQPQQ